MLRQLLLAGHLLAQLGLHPFEVMMRGAFSTFIRVHRKAVGQAASAASLAVDVLAQQGRHAEVSGCVTEGVTRIDCNDRGQLAASAASRG